MVVLWLLWLVVVVAVVVVLLVVLDVVVVGFRVSLSGLGFGVSCEGLGRARRVGGVCKHNARSMGFKSWKGLVCVEAKPAGKNKSRGVGGWGGSIPPFANATLCNMGLEGTRML